MGGKLNRAEYKVLKYLRDAHFPQDVAKKYTPDAVQTLVDLRDKGFLFCFADGTYRANSAGANALREFKRERRKEWLDRLLWPLLAAVIGGVLAGILLVILQRT